MKKLLIGALVAGGMAGASLTPALADEEAADKGVTCVDVARMHHSKIVDNETIILYMRGGPDYKMKLAQRCPGLKIQGTWFHDARGLAKLCSVDVIQVPVTTTGNLLDTPTRPCIIESITEYDEKAEKAEKAS